MHTWKQVVEVANRISEEKGIVTQDDLREQLGVNEKTAIEYIGKICSTDEWGFEPAVSRSKSYLKRRENQVLRIYHCYQGAKTK